MPTDFVRETDFVRFRDGVAISDDSSYFVFVREMGPTDVEAKGYPPAVEDGAGLVVLEVERSVGGRVAHAACSDDPT